MAAASTDRNPYKSDGDVRLHKVAASTTVYAGTLVVHNSGGYLEPLADAASKKFCGVAIEKGANAAGANGAVSVKVFERGEAEFDYNGADATQAVEGKLCYGVNDQTVDDDPAATTHDIPVGIITEFVSASKVRVRFARGVVGANELSAGAVAAAGIGVGSVGPTALAADAVEAAAIATGAVTPDALAAGAVETAALATNPKTFVHTAILAPGAAGGDLTDIPLFVAPAGGATLTKVGIVPQGSPAAIDDGNTCVVDIKDGAGNTIVTKTYNTATQPPAASGYASLGTLDATHKVLTANEVVMASITQGAASDLGSALISVEWQPAA